MGYLLLFLGLLLQYFQRTFSFLFISFDKIKSKAAAKVIPFF